MGKGQVLAVLVVVGLVVAVMVVAWAEEGKKEGKASLDRVPAAVKETILKEAKGNSVKEIDQKTENGKTVYEAEWTMVVKATVDAEGTLLRRAVEEKVAMEAVPAAVKEALLKEAKGGEVQEVKRRTQGDTVTYGADVVVEGKKTEVTLTADGTVTSRQVGEDVENENEGENQAEGEHQGENQEAVTLDKLPAPVRKTIEEAAKGGKVQKVGQETEGGKTVYGADVTIEGKEFQVKVTPDGKLLSKEAEESEE